MKFAPVSLTKVHHIRTLEFLQRQHTFLNSEPVHLWLSPPPRPHPCLTLSTVSPHSVGARVWWRRGAKCFQVYILYLWHCIFVIVVAKLFTLVMIFFAHSFLSLYRAPPACARHRVRAAKSKGRDSCIQEGSILWKVSLYYCSSISAMRRSCLF